MQSGSSVYGACVCACDKPTSMATQSARARAFVVFCSCAIIRQLIPTTEAASRSCRVGVHDTRSFLRSAVGYGISSCSTIHANRSNQLRNIAKLLLRTNNARANANRTVDRNRRTTINIAAAQRTDRPSDRALLEGQQQRRRRTRAHNYCTYTQ